MLLDRLEHGVSGEDTYWRNKLTLNTRRNIMKSIGRAGLLFLFVVVCTLMMVSQSQAKVSSHKINAKDFGQFSNGTTEAQIVGGGLLQGTAVGNWEVVSDASFPVLDLIGDVTFTTNKGTLTVTVTGTFNVFTGDFFAEGPVTDAEGKLEGAEGFLTFVGIQDPTGMFVEDITGVITVDLSPRR